MRYQPIQANIFVMSGEKGHEMIYKVDEFRQIDSREHCLVYSMSLVAGKDYIDPDRSDVQGYVRADRFTSNVQSEYFTVNPLQESLGDRLKEEGYEVINISHYLIWGYESEDDIPEHLRYIDEVVKQMKRKEDLYY